MKKSKILTTIVLFFNIFSVVSANAGDIGDQTTTRSTIINSYLSAEAAYSWYDRPSVFSINNQREEVHHQGWGGRIGAGLLFTPSNNWKYTSEVGWGYYAKSSSSGLQSELHASAIYDGFDLLVGLDRKYKNIDFFLKGGAMILDRRHTVSKSLTANLPTSGVIDVSSSHYNTTQVLPEIKVGGIYNITEKWGVTLSYMHIFGSEPSYSSNTSATTGGNITISKSSSQLPTFNTILFGLNYIFA